MTGDREQNTKLFSLKCVLMLYTLTFNLAPYVRFETDYNVALIFRSHFETGKAIWFNAKTNCWHLIRTDDCSKRYKCEHPFQEKKMEDNVPCRMFGENTIIKSRCKCL